MMKVSKLIGSAVALSCRPHTLLARPRTLLLVGHMRSYSSLLSHILGGHPEIVGHRERHRSYTRAWHLLYLRYHVYLDNRRGGGRYVFDKLLHNHCRLGPRVLARPDVRLLVMIRRPEPTIKSVLNLARSRRDVREFGDPEWVANYYCARLDRIVDEIRQAPGPVAFIHAEDLVERTAELLTDLSDWLGLSSQLLPEYPVFADTGVPGRGDSAGDIRAGRVLAPRPNRHAGIEIPPVVLERAEQAYERTRRALIGADRVRGTGQVLAFCRKGATWRTAQGGGAVAGLGPDVRVGGGAS